LEAAEPAYDAALAAPPEETTQPEYVYLSRVFAGQGVPPKANIPTVEFPVADPRYDAALAAVAVAFTSPEYVYLFRVVEIAPETYPKAKIPTVAVPVAD